MRRGGGERATRAARRLCLLGCKSHGRPGQPAAGVQLSRLQCLPSSKGLTPEAVLGLRIGTAAGFLEGKPEISVGGGVLRGGGGERGRASSSALPVLTVLLSRP